MEAHGGSRGQSKRSEYQACILGQPDYIPNYDHPQKKYRSFQCLWEDGRSEMIILALECLAMYKKPSVGSFTLKKSKSKAMKGTLRPLSLKMTSSPTRTPQKMGESWAGRTLKCCKTLLIKGSKGSGGYSRRPPQRSKPYSALKRCRK